jgi:copper oxidase (laccase) domain-containing protein
LTLAHIGRQASEADTLAKAITFLETKGSRPEDLLIWMAPAVKQEHYRMDYFTKEDDSLWQGYFIEKADGVYLDLQGYNRSRAEAMGVLPEHIVISDVDTAVDSHYFSHSQGDTSGRFAVVAMLRP